MALIACLMVPVAGLGGASKAKTNSPSAAGTGFVTRLGPRLYLNNRVFRFAGANIDWLGLVSDTWKDTYYPARTRLTMGLRRHGK